MPLLLMHCFNYLNSPKTNDTIINTTTGQELMYLQEALDSGAITQEEYDELRKKIMERYDALVDSTDTN